MKPDTDQRSFWPYGLIITFVVFIGLIVSFVVVAVRSDMDLVRDDYYEQEVRYQEQIDREARTAAVGTQVKVTYDANAANVELQIPAEHAARHASGTVKLYRPSDASLDKEMPLATNAAGMQKLDVAQLTAGLWRVQVVWRVEGDEFSASDHFIIERPGS